MAAQGALSDNGIWHSYIECSAKVLGDVLHVGILEAAIGGAFKFEFAGKSNGQSQLTFFYGVAGVVKLGQELILSVAGGRAISLVVREVKGGAQKIALGFASEWEVEGTLLFGLAAVKLSFELLLLLERAPLDDYHFVGETTLAIDVTLGWVFSKTFEVEFKMGETLAAAVFVATTVLPIK